MSHLHHFKTDGYESSEKCPNVYEGCPRCHGTGRRNIIEGIKILNNERCLEKGCTFVMGDITSIFKS